MKWREAAKVLLVFVIPILMTGAKGSGASGSSEDCADVINVFSAVRMSHYTAAAPLSVHQVHASKDAQVEKGGAILTVECQGNKKTIRAPHALVVDNMYVSKGQQVGKDGHLFDASPPRL